MREHGGDVVDVRGLPGREHGLLERATQLLGSREAVARIAGERAIDDAAHETGHRLRQRRVRRAGHEVVKSRKLATFVGVAHGPAGEELVENRAQRVHVGAPVERIAARLLGRHVLDLALERAGLGRLAAPRVGLRDAEVDELRGPADRDEEVLRGDVAMDDTERIAVVAVKLVSRMQATTRIGDDAQRNAHGERGPGRADVAIQLPQRLTVDQLHRIVEEPAVLADLEDARDVLVIDLRGDLRLVEEHVAELAIVRVRREDGLQRDEALESELAAHARKPDGAHSALRENAEQLVTVESVPRS